MIRTSERNCDAPLGRWAPFVRTHFFTVMFRACCSLLLLFFFLSFSLPPFFLHSFIHSCVHSFFSPSIALTKRFGIVIHADHQRQGFCSEAFEANCRFARDTLGCHTVRAATLATNTTMLHFLRSRGFRAAGSHPSDDGQSEWLDFVRALDPPSPPAAQQQATRQ